MLNDVPFFADFNKVGFVRKFFKPSKVTGENHSYTLDSFLRYGLDIIEGTLAYELDNTYMAEKFNKSNRALALYDFWIGFERIAISRKSHAMLKLGEYESKEITFDIADLAMLMFDAYNNEQHDLFSQRIDTIIDYFVTDLSGSALHKKLLSSVWHDLHNNVERGDQAYGRASILKKVGEPATMLEKVRDVYQRLGGE
jgi:hypothetical protein